MRTFLLAALTATVLIIQVDLASAWGSSHWQKKNNYNQEKEKENVNNRSPCSEGGACDQLPCGLDGFEDCPCQFEDDDEGYKIYPNRDFDEEGQDYCTGIYPGHYLDKKADGTDTFNYKTYKYKKEGNTRVYYYEQESRQQGFYKYNQQWHWYFFDGLNRLHQYYKRSNKRVYFITRDVNSWKFWKSGVTPKQWRDSDKDGWGSISGRSRCNYKYHDGVYIYYYKDKDGIERGQYRIDNILCYYYFDDGQLFQYYKDGKNKERYFDNKSTIDGQVDLLYVRGRSKCNSGGIGGPKGHRKLCVAFENAYTIKHGFSIGYRQECLRGQDKCIIEQDSYGLFHRRCGAKSECMDLGLLQTEYCTAAGCKLFKCEATGCTYQIEQKLFFSFTKEGEKCGCDAWCWETYIGRDDCCEDACGFCTEGAGGTSHCPQPLGGS